ncbi:hypothetical protein PFISCL1PPCAC_2939 [Pristionchus fissidentatus]|uniref:F-box domain-containing protein n=1 Tax=Pristionchus fissidentatus TaxID=1538716 RepID=A0AAV5UYI8_9BILA|nr:hypothetical protein PFISCL1PPCAC_2939 [Pristionchus fissidentatus]
MDEINISHAFAIRDSSVGTVSLTFTTLPIDCMLKIFSFLDRDSLDKMELVSRNMNEFASRKTFQSIKRVLKSLTIFRDGASYAIFVSGKLRDYVYRFNHAGCDQYGGCSKLTKLLNNEVVLTKAYRQCASDGSHVLERLFSRLAVLLRKNVCEEYCIREVFVDNNFTDRFIANFPDSVQKFTVDGAIFVDQNAAAIKKFVQWMRDVPPKNIEIANTEIEKFRNFNELQRFLFLQVGWFFTSPREVEFIRNYKTLIIGSALIEQNLFLDLINNRLDDDELIEGTWSFGLAGVFISPNSFLFGMRNIRTASAPARTGDRYYRQVSECTVARSDNNNSALLKFHNLMGTDFTRDRDRFPVVSVTFFNNQEFFQPRR